MSGGVQRVEKVFSTRCEWKAGKLSFHSKHQFAVKWHFKHQKMPEMLILRSQIDIGSNILLLLGDVHAAACGLKSKDCGPSMYPGDFVDRLNTADVMSGGVCFL